MKYSKAADFHRSIEDAIEQWWIVVKQSLDERQVSLMEWQDVVDLYWEHLLND